MANITLNKKRITIVNVFLINTHYIISGNLTFEILHMIV